MGLFNIDIEKYYQEEIDRGNQLMGMFCLQYPIYCIHANILDTTPEPLENLDKIIIDFLNTKPNFTSLQIASLIGASKSLVEMRISTLLTDELIKINGKELIMTPSGIEVFKNKSQVRKHKRSYDFYLDGTTLQPLPEVFYGYYCYKYISEHDSILKTKRGEDVIFRPFGPDLVHTPPDKEIITDKILSLEKSERLSFAIPEGLEKIVDLSYTKLSLQLLVSVTKNKGVVSKELIDPFGIFSSGDKIPYLEALKRNIRIFEPLLNERISNLEFRLTIPRKRDGDSKDALPILSSNWPEIDKFKESQHKCFSFAKDDVTKAIKGIYDIKHLDLDSLVNTETDLEISITKKMLLESANKHKLISDLIRKRDYKFGNVDNNVFLLYIYYKTNDPYVKEIIQFKELVNIAKQKSEVCEQWILKQKNNFTIDYRELFVSSGELDLLERIDIEKYMLQLN
jgi:hypothetical protein